MEDLLINLIYQHNENGQLILSASANTTLSRAELVEWLYMAAESIEDMPEPERVLRRIK